MKKAMLFLALAAAMMSLFGCSGGGGQLEEEGPAVQTSAVVPFEAGGKAAFKDGVMVDTNTGRRTSGVTAEALAGGKVKITGKLISQVAGVAPLVVDEEITFQKNGNSLLIVSDRVKNSSEDGSQTSTVTMTFTPPVAFIKDINSMNVDDEAKTEHVSVTYRGDVAQFHFVTVPATTSILTLPADKTDVTVTTEIYGTKTVTIDGADETAYLVSTFNPNDSNAARENTNDPWFNNISFSYLWGLGFVNGGGIASIHRAPIVSAD